MEILTDSDTGNRDRVTSPARLMFQSVASTGARAATTVAMLLAVGLAARKMTAEEFGLWSILLSLMFLATNFDLGFRYGLSNRLVALVARQGDKSKPDELAMFVSVFVLLAAIGVFGAAACLCLLPRLPWAGLFNIHQADLAARVAFIMSVVTALLFINLPLSLWGAGFYAHQEITRGSVLLGAQSFVLLGVFAVAVINLPFQEAVFAYFAANVVTGAVLTVVLLVHRGWRPGWIAAVEQWRQLRSISRQSLEFFVLSMSATLTAIAGTFFSGTVTGLKEAGDFSLIQKIFTLLISLHLAFMTPVASAYTWHAELGNWDWVREKLSMTARRLWPLVFLGGGAALFALHPVLIRVWTGKWLTDFTLAGMLACWALATGWTNTHAILLNSLGLVRFQGAVCLAMVAPVLILPVILGRLWGVHGVALASLICAIPLAALWPPYTARALKKKLLRI